MSDPKRHHYVPRVYLAEFTSETGSLLVLEKPGGKQFPSSPANAAVQTHLNTVYYGDGTKDQRSLEEFFGNIEAEYPRFVSQVREGTIDGDTIDYFVKLAIHQRMRTPKVRMQLAILISKLDETGALEKAKSGFSEHELSLLRNAKDHKKKALNQLGMSLSGHFGLATGMILDGMGFAFLRNETNLQLHSCDNPVIVSGFSIARRKNVALLPFPSNRRILVFPISQDLLLYGDTDLKSGAGYIIFRNEPTLRRKTVDRINRLIALSADRYVFLPGDETRLPPSVCLKNRLDDEKQSLRVFNGPYSDLLREVVRDLRALAL